MSVRQIRCPECKGADIEVVRRGGADGSMNDKARLRCICGHEWDGRVMSKELQSYPMVRV